MNQEQLSQSFLYQSKYLIWIIDLKYRLIYANAAYQRFMKESFGDEKKLEDLVFKKEFGEKVNKEWKDHYTRAINGEQFEIEEQFYHLKTKETQYNIVYFQPLYDDENKVCAVACEARDISQLVKKRYESNELIDASLDVFCSIDEEGNFVHVSAAAKDLWGYSPEELEGQPYVDYILEEDIPKTNAIAADIMAGQEIKTFVNRYRKKEGGIAYNSWSARWDSKVKIMYCVARDAQEKTEQEDILYQSEQRFKALVQEGSDLIGILDEEGNYKYVSPTSTAVLGIRPEEFIGRSAFDFIHPEDVEIVAECLQKLKTTDRIKIDAFRFQNNKKEWRWIETVLTNMMGNPAVNGIVSNSRDITEEKKLKKLSKQANELAKVGGWEYDLINDELIWSDEVHELHETDPESFTPKVEKAIEFYKEEHKPFVRNAIEKSISEGIYLDYQAVIITKNKKERWVRVIGSPEYSQGSCIRFIGSFQNITEQKEADRRLIVANERFEKVTEATNDVIWDWDITNDVFYRSKAIERFFGKDAFKTIREADFWKDSFHPEDKEKLKRSVEEAIADKNCSRWKEEYKLLNDQGEILYIVDQGVIIRNENGKATRMVGAMTDISERKQLEIELKTLNESLQQHAFELERSNEELEQFAFITSHDMQEPLRMISSFMEQLKRKYGDQLDEKGLEYIHFATDGARRMKQIILDLLEYSRANRPDEEIEEVDLNEIFFSFQELRRKLISDNSVTIKSDTLPTLKTYRALITQIFHCLLDNAIKYSKAEEETLVEVKVTDKAVEWEFSIADNGIGIDPQFHDKIFVIFQRLHNRDEYDGTGIGLPIAKRSVEFLGGKIWLESEVGKGTTFFFTILKNNLTN